MSKPKITAGIYPGDDADHCWAIFVDNRPVMTGLLRSQVPYYKKLAVEKYAMKSTQS